MPGTITIKGGLDSVIKNDENDNLIVSTAGATKKVFFQGTGSSDSATPDLPDPFDNVLSLYAIYRSYQQQEDGGMAQQYYVAFLGELSNLAARYQDTPAPQPMILNSRRVSRWGSQFLPARLRYSWE